MLTLEERERIAYANGDVATVAVIHDLENEALELAFQEADGVAGCCGACDCPDCRAGAA